MSNEPGLERDGLTLVSLAFSVSVRSKLLHLVMSASVVLSEDLAALCLLL